MTLAEFISARLDEWETIATEAEHFDGPTTLQWRLGGTRVHAFDNGRSEAYGAVFCGDWARILVARDDVGGFRVSKHIAEHDPALVLRQVKVMRGFVRMAEIGSDTRLVGFDSGFDKGYQGAADDVLSDLAEIWSDHPDYRSEWAV